MQNFYKVKSTSLGRLTVSLIMGAATSAMLMSAVCMPASAGDTSEVWNLFQGAPKIKDDNGNYWKLRGRILWDGASISETKTNGLENKFKDSEFRAARIGIEGQYQQFKYKAEVDFGGGKTTAKDVNVTWKGPVAVTVGQMKAGGSMEELNSGRHVTFTERGMITDAVGFDRRIGINVGKSGDTYSLNAGVFGNSIDGAVDGAPSNTVFAARATYAPIIRKNMIVHVGASLRHTDTQRGAPSRSARWGSHLATEKVKPNVGDDAMLIGAELATVQGPFHLHGEYMNEDGDSGSVEGGFIQAGYFLTGETRKYKSSGGKFDRTKPGKPLSKGGIGAWEVAARLDSLDATNAFDEKVGSWTAGLTWYPESHLRLKLNYTDASGDTFSAKGIYTRLQVDW